MNRRVILSGIFLILYFVAWSPAALALTGPGARCGTHEPTPEAMAAVQARLDALLADGGPLAEKSPLLVPIAFHVLYYEMGPGLFIGAVGDTTLIEQVDVLNAAYASSGVQFTLASIDRTESKDWCRLSFNSVEEQECKAALAIDPATTLNIYTGDLNANLLGWSWFPDDWPEDSTMHGTVLHYNSLPGGAYAAYNEGDTATHEIGHYLGLYHTFQGGCSEPNDHCDDTPQEASPDYYCTEGRDSCPDDPGLDPIHNFMDYTPDSCMIEFTPQQALRMALMVQTFRPTLWAGSASPVWDLPRRDEPVRMSIAPNPFNPRTEILLSLVRGTAVRLDVYDLAGRRVRTLVDRPLDAGEHNLVFDGQGLASGVYLVNLVTGDGQKIRDRVVLLK